MLFKNANESAYAGGRKHWTDVIKNSGDSSFLIWRQPEEDFNTNSTLIVMPGESAVFIDGGKIVTVFGESGTYKLETQNFPFISRLRNAFSGGVSIFNCVVYFVRTTVTKEIFWGTDNRIQVRDKVHGIRTDVGASGSYKIRITDPETFLRACVGNNVISQSPEDVMAYYEHEFLSVIKSSISQKLNALDRELLGLDAELVNLSNEIQPMIRQSLQPYGVACEKFTISALVVDTSKYDRLDETTIDGVRAMRLKEFNAIGDEKAFEILGDHWVLQKEAEILTNLSNNPGTGGMAAAPAGIGMGMAAAPVFSDMMRHFYEQPLSRRTGSSLEEPERQVRSSGRYVQKDAQAKSGGTLAEKLKQIEEAHEMGLLTDEEYQQKRGQILEEL